MTYLLVLIVVILFTCVCSMHFNLRKAAEIRANDLIELAKQDNELIELRRKNAELAAEIKQLRWRAADAEKNILAGRKRENSSAATNSSPAASSVSDSHRRADPVDSLSPLSPLNPMSPVYVGADYASEPDKTVTHCPEPSTRSSSNSCGSSYGGSSSYDSGSSYSSDSGSSSSSSSSCD